MKKFLLAIFALAITCPTFAQFTTSGNVTSTTNAVGIGTTSPNSTLTVNGSFDVSNNGNLLFYNGAADINFRFAGRGSGGRALVHEAGNMLVLNYGGDFTGGTMLGTNAYFTQSSSGSSYIQFGKVGIGTNNPAYKLDVIGPGRFTTGAYVNDGQAFGVVSSVGNVWANNTLIYKGYNNGDFAEILVPGGSIYPANIRLLQNGNVGIGTTTPDQKLTVNGTIHSKEIKVDLNVPGPDYVFEPDYQLMELSKLKAYLDKNHHLPEIASADQMAKDGLNLGEMNTKLLKKVEELTLYVIEKDKQLAEQNEKIIGQQKVNYEQARTNQSQQEQLNELKAKFEILLNSSGKK
jgi:hypothetical protein